MNARRIVTALNWVAAVVLVVVGWTELVRSGRLHDTGGGQDIFLTAAVLAAPALGQTLLRRHPDEWTGPVWGACVLMTMWAATRTTGLGWLTPVAGPLALVIALLPAVLAVRHPALRGGRAAVVAIGWCWAATGLGGVLITVLVMTAGEVPVPWWFTEHPGPAGAAGLVMVGYAIVVLGGAVLTVLVAGRRYRGMPPAGRSALRPLVIPLIGWAVAAAAGAVWSTIAGLAAPIQSDLGLATTVFVVLPAFLVAMLAAGVGWVDLMVRRPARPSVGPGATRGRTGETYVERYLSRALADPSIRVLYPARPEPPESVEGWVDSQGRPVVPDVDDPDRAATVIRRGSTLIGMIEQDAAVTARPEAVELVATGAGLIMETERLMAAARRDLEESRLLATRLLSAADEPRTVLREELVAGPLRELDKVRTDLTTGSSLTAVLPRLNLIAAQVRNISHGVFPTSLAEGGLRAALPQAVVPDRRYPQIVEMTAYLAAGTDPGPRIGEIRFADGPGLEVRTTRPPTLMVRDRVAALGGRVTGTGAGWVVTMPIAGT